MNRMTVFQAMLVCALVASLGLSPATVHASRWEIRQEFREGAREVDREKREALREIRRCKTKDCARREIREGYREVQREKREARREIRREIREHRDDRDDARKLLTGIAIGAAVLGIANAVSNSNESWD
jgi:hypothetical protein